MLLDKGAEVNKAVFVGCRLGTTALHFACEYGHLECVQVLLKHSDIKINVETGEGATPLSIALGEYNKNIVEALLERLDLTIELQQQIAVFLQEGFNPQDSITNAILYYQVMTHSAPNVSTYWHNLGCFYHANKEFHEAQHCFQRALSLGRHQSTLCVYAHFLLEATDHLLATLPEEDPLLLLQEVLNAPPDDSELSYSMLEYDTIKHAPLGDELLHYEKFPIHPQTLAVWLFHQYFKHDERVNLNERLARIIVLMARLGNETPDHEIEWVLCCHLLIDIGCIKAAMICFGFVENPSEKINAFQECLEFYDSLIQSSKEAQLLIASTCEGKLDGVRFCCDILEVDINLIIDNSEGQYTALHWACIKKHIPIIQYLLDHGASFDILDVNEQFAWEYITSKPEIIVLFQKALLIKYNLIFSDSFFPSSKKELEKLFRIGVIQGNISDVRYCYECLEVDLNAPSGGLQKTPLHWAVVNGHVDIVRYLISKQAQVYLIDIKGKTALDYAQELENSPTKEALLTALGQQPAVRLVFTTP